MFTEGEPEFCSAEHKTSYLSMLMRIDRRFMGKCFGQMQELGIYPGQIPVLGLLAYKDGLSQREIAEKLRIKPPTVNVTVQRLEKAGFLYREADEKDQRISRIYLTEKGKQAKVSLNWMQAVLCVEFEDMDEAVAVSMQKSDDVDNVEIEQANEGELL